MLSLIFAAAVAVVAPEWNTDVALEARGYAIRTSPSDDGMVEIVVIGMRHDAVYIASNASDISVFQYGIIAGNSVEFSVPLASGSYVLDAVNSNTGTVSRVATVSFSQVQNLSSGDNDDDVGLPNGTMAGADGKGNEVVAKSIDCKKANGCTVTIKWESTTANPNPETFELAKDETLTYNVDDVVWARCICS